MPTQLNRKLRMGMVGGGRGAFIGGVHRIAAMLDNEVELVAGCLSSDPKRARESGKDLYLAPDRIYTDYGEMAKAEKERDDGIDFVAIVTPNFMHVPVAEAFAKAGHHIVCDKPLAMSLAEAKKLRTLVKRKKKVFALTHNYTGYPLVKEARELVRKGKLGRILKIVAEYPQGWLLKAIENEEQKQAAWRTDPKKAGASCCVGDIGTHAENLARYITGLEIDELIAEFTTFVPGRPLEDDANILVRFKGGAKGIIYASQISAGEENGPLIRVYGTKGSLEWHQPEPNRMILKWPDQPDQILRPSNPYLSKEANRFSRVPPGHPEAFLEAFANVYREATRAIRDDLEGRKPKTRDFPTIDDGVYGNAFIETCVQSAKSNRWTKMKK